jgi:DNA-binding NarL/FixJ family response regulator
MDRLFIIAEDLLTRAGLAALLDESFDFGIVGQSAGGETLNFDIDIYQPDLIVCEVGYNADLQALNTWAALDLPLVVLLPDDAHASSVLPLLAALPAYGLVQRGGSRDLMMQAVTAVASGLIVIDPAFADVLPARTVSTEIPPLLDDLTGREREVLHALAEGLPNKAIAAQLSISPNTVKFHINAIFSKMNVTSRTEAVVRAAQLGLILL